MNLIDKENGVRIVLQGFEHAFEPLFKVTPVFRAREKRAHIERVHNGIGQYIRHISIDNPSRQAFGNGGFTNPGFADQQRVVLASAAENLHHTFQLFFATDQRIDFAFVGQGIEIDGVLLKWSVLCFFSGLGITILALRLGAITRYFGNAM